MMVMMTMVTRVMMMTTTMIIQHQWPSLSKIGGIKINCRMWLKEFMNPAGSLTADVETEGHHVMTGPRYGAIPTELLLSPHVPHRQVKPGESAFSPRKG